MSTTALSLGLDVGAIAVHAAVIDEQGRVIARRSRPHHGELLPTVRAVIEDLPRATEIGRLELVGSQAHPVGMALGIEPGDSVDATLRAVRAAVPGVRQVIDAGGSSLSLIRLHPDGRFAGFQANTLCAAGTGSFLDEQAARLGFRQEELADLPLVEDPPDVAARCAVFAKSDLIHRQQEGYSREDCWAGLCRGLARTMVMTLFKGRTPESPLALVGGVALNPEVVRSLEGELKVDIVVPDHPDTVTALGAAMAAGPLKNGLNLEALRGRGSEAEGATRREALVLDKTRYPSFEVQEEWLDDNATEMRISAWPGGDVLEGTLGIDIGSTSTKAALVDDQGTVILDMYRRTAGDPIGATRHLLEALRTLATDRGVTLNITGMGTTGSGRKLVGAVFGADAVINEISAHVAGAIHTDPSIDTIFEIGGQDAKYVHTMDGHLHEANMNYVCAAGTGSFVEELSRKLGFELHTLGDQLLGVEPPVTSDRCTVFMEQDARHLLRQGFSPREVMGAVVYSVVQNYLTKVVGHRPRSKERVFFQGATARNKALVAAFEKLLDVEIVVSPYAHVMGCWGVALLTRQRLAAEGSATRFMGVAMADREVRLESSTCRLCSNNCHITHAHVQGLEQVPSWGYLCGRDPEEEKVRANTQYRPFRERAKLHRLAGKTTLPKDAPLVHMPRALLAHAYAPFWRAFLGELGHRLVLSRPTDPSVVKGASDWVGADYCFPVKLAHGHLRRLVEELDPHETILVPYMIAAAAQKKTLGSWFCPYNLGLPAMLEAAAQLRGVPLAERLIKPTVDLRWDERTAGKKLHGELAAKLGGSRKDYERAWLRARQVMTTLDEDMRSLGEQELARIRSSGKPAVVIMGRPYNVFDAGANLALPEKLSQMGIDVIPMDLLPLEDEPLDDTFRNMFWNFGRRILEACSLVARSPDLYAVGFTNFSCGPDAFIWSYAERIMGRKPMLVLELDEHGADAGYLTRLEAFADVIAANQTKTVPRFRIQSKLVNGESLNGTTLWIPAMHEAGSALVAASLRHNGIPAQPLPPETDEAFVRGRGSTRGGECLPCPATLGSFLDTVKKAGGGRGKHALLMPTASGPCRFGQYCTQNRLALDDEGWDPVRIVSWTSSNNYAGLPHAARRYMWTGLLLGDLLFKLRCRVLPYEVNEGETEALFERWRDRLVVAMEQGLKLETEVKAAHDAFAAIPRHAGRKPLVGVVGEIYVRSNRFTNQDVVRTIEAAGGEAWLAPISEWILYIGYLDTHGLGNAATGFRARLAAWARNSFLERDERKWLALASPLLDDRHEPTVQDTVAAGRRWVPEEFVGETILTIGRTIEFMKGGADMVVNAAPFGCMPGAMTSGVLQAVEAEYGVPVASMFYDGEGGGVNDRLYTYIANLHGSAAGVTAVAK
jgi:predicted CoA-substrate-specific enzyme activase